MPLKRLLNLPHSLLILFIATSCASIPDVPVCVEETPSQAFCTYTISDKDFYINDSQKFDSQTYWDIKPTMLRIPYKSWVQLKSYIIKQCKKNNCDKDIASWDRKLSTIEEKLKPIEIDKE